MKKSQSSLVCSREVVSNMGKQVTPLSKIRF